jgi:hypothetical protein
MSLREVSDANRDKTMLIGELLLNEWGDDNECLAEL